MVVRLRVDAGLRRDFAEPRAAVRAVPFVQEQLVADTEVVRREARRGAGDRRIGLGIAGDEEVRPAVAVHVRNRGARVPAVGDDAV